MNFSFSSWHILIIAGLLEVVWAVGLKYTQGFSKLLPSIVTIVALSLSMFLLAKATTSLPISIAYAVWVGIGVLGTALFGMLVLGESFSLYKLLFLVLLLVSILGLKFSSDI